MEESVRPLIQVRPTIINFVNFQPGQVLQRDFQITNITMQDQRIYCSFPTTKYFSLTYKKEQYLNPGLSLKVSVIFKPDNSNYYSDSVRVLCKQSPEVIVQIQGFATTPIVTFPSLLEFPITPVGQSCSLPCDLSCSSPIDLRFSLQLRPQDVSFTVKPSSGILSSTGRKSQAVVTYEPKVKGDAKVDLLLKIENLEIPARSCRIVAGTSEKTKKEKSSEEALKDVRRSEINESHSTSLKSRHKGIMTDKKSPKPRRSDSQISSAEMESLFHSIDVTLSKSTDSTKTPFQKSKKPLVKQAKDTASTSPHIPKKNQRAIKESLFLEELRKRNEEEKKVEMSWCVRLGTDPLTTEERANILMNRQLHKDKLRMKDDFMSVRNKETVLLKRRSIRDLSSEPPRFEGIDFDKPCNNPWPIRVRNLNRIRQAIWKTILRIRMTKRLQTMQEWLRTRQYRESRVTDISPDDVQYLERMPFTVKAEKITHTPQTIFWREEYEDILPKSLEKEHVLPMPFLIEWIPTWLPAKYPQEYQILGYTSLNIQEFRNSYVSTAKAELTEQKCLYETLIDQFSGKEKFPDKKAIEEKMEALLVPPESLFFPMDINTVTLFNPKPGVQQFMPLHPTTEMDPDFCLYPLSETGGTHLDPEEVVTGVLVSKHFAFPSEAFLNRNASPTIPASLYPRWKSGFNTEVLPREGPSLLHGSIPEEISRKEDPDTAELESRIRPMLNKLTSLDKFLKSPDKSEVVSKLGSSSTSKTSSSK